MIWSQVGVSVQPEVDMPFCTSGTQSGTPGGNGEANPGPSSGSNPPLPAAMIQLSRVTTTIWPRRGLVTRLCNLGDYAVD